jgi:16S rRNA G1207 methylase RsmC
MARATRGRAGREQRREESLAAYGATLAQMLQAQIRPDSGERMLHLGRPGATQLATQMAHRLDTGEVVVCVYTYDELEEARAELAGLGNVHVINELDDLDEGEPPFDIVTCIAPYHLGRDAVVAYIEQGLDRLAPNGAFYLGGDRQLEMDRYVEALSRRVHDVKEVASNGQYRVVVAQGRNLRKSGTISGRRS